MLQYEGGFCCRILIDLTVTIECTKEGVKFGCNGDIGSGAVTLRSHTDVEKPDRNIEIQLSEPVALTFSLKYLVNFCKASGLSEQVKLCLSNEVPLLVEYTLSNNSYLRFYLAPKVRRAALSPQSSSSSANRTCRSATRSKYVTIIGHRRGDLDSLLGLVREHCHWWGGISHGWSCQNGG